MKFPKFKFVLNDSEPAFDIAPHSARMACCYCDKAGTYHLFVDYIDASLNTIHSFQAKINYYRSRDLKKWEFVDTVVDKGKYNKNPVLRAADCYGVGSPDVVCAKDEVYLFYAGRGNLNPNQKMDGFSQKGQSGYVSGAIILAKAPTDINGAPCGEFKKQKNVIEMEYDWENMRIDDPSALIEGETIHLYYKGFNDNTDRSNIKVGYAVANLKDMAFIKKLEPIISVYEGCEMPRVFKYNGRWNMFLRHFDNKQGDVWRHYVSEDGVNWEIHDAYLFGCAGENPGKGATDIMLIKNVDGAFSGKALACGMETGVLKLWLYDIIEK